MFCMFSSLLIANRGEIACRIIRTAQAMGIRTIAIHGDADARNRNVREADAAERIAPDLSGEHRSEDGRIVAAALQSGAEAVHPGWGALAQDADFAAAVIAAGQIWVGSDPASMRLMGNGSTTGAVQIGPVADEGPGSVRSDSPASSAPTRSGGEKRQ